MTLRCLEPLALKFKGQAVEFEPGACFTVSPDQAARIVAKFAGKLEVLTLPLDLPTEPLQPGWLVAYRDRAGRLAGGCDDRANGTVAGCTWDSGCWTVRLTNGDTLPLRRILSVSKTDAAGLIVAAWSTRDHGYDGTRTTSSDGDALLAQPPQGKGTSACFACGGARRWLSIHGAIVCGTCHPPADAALVERWIEGA